MKFLGQQVTPIELVLRVGIFGTYLGHGIFAFYQKVDWIPFLTFWGFTEKSALQVMPFIGIVDLMVATIVLIRPLRSVLLYAALWAFLTALMRPLTGQGILEFIERSANWAAPLALLLILNQRKQMD